MERNEISIHEARFYSAMLKHPDKWWTSKELAEAAEIAPRTARAFALKYTGLGLVDMAETYPGHRYQLSGKASKRNAAYCVRLEKAMDVLGLPAGRAQK